MCATERGHRLRSEDIPACQYTQVCSCMEWDVVLFGFHWLLRSDYLGLSPLLSGCMSLGWFPNQVLSC